MKKSIINYSILLAISFQPSAMAAPDVTKMYGAAAPFTIENLPASRLKSQLEKLPAPAKERALTWLLSFDFPEHDLEYLHADPNGGIYYEDTFLPDAVSQAELEANPALEGITAVDAFKLHSKPNASKTVYLNFVGATVSGTAWNNSTGVNSYQAKPFDSDGNPSNFSTTERNQIAEIWHRVAEDYAPFDIDVTTEAPSSFGPTVGHVLITSSTDSTGTAMPHSGAGGVAYVGVWGTSYFTSYQPAFVYYDNLGPSHPPFVAEAASHELGHNLNLGHDGTSTQGYYTGHGSNLTSWAPIMGVGYYTNVTQWSKGDYADANNAQDDLNIIDGYLSYSNDDHANISSSATALLVDENGYIAASHPEIDPDNMRVDNKGVIETSIDKDVFYFDTAAGDINLNISPAWISYTRAGTQYQGRGANLDIQARLFDDHGYELVIDPTDNTNSVISANLTEGRYYLEISGVGNAQSPYSDYASLGNYYISGQVVPFTNDETAPTPNPSQWASSPSVLGRDTIEMSAVTAVDDSGLVEYQFICTQGGANCVASNWQTSTDYLATGLAPATTYSFQVKARDTFGNETNLSTNASGTTDANSVPIANDDDYQINQDQTTLFNVIANDSDADNDNLAIQNTGLAQHGSVSVSNGQIQYTPNSGYAGTDSFTYTITDGFGESAPAIVTVTINAINQPPLAVADNAEVLIGNNSSVDINVLGNDSDPEGDTLTIVGFTDGGKGSVSLVNNTLRYTTNSSKSRGGDSFSYTISDGLSTATATVNVSIVRSLSDGGDDGDGTSGGSNGGKKCNPRKQECS
jgi:hypothetical protein